MQTIRKSLKFQRFFVGPGGQGGGSDDDGAACQGSYGGYLVEEEGSKKDAIEGFKGGDDADGGGPELFQG